MNDSKLLRSIAMPMIVLSIAITHASLSQAETAAFQKKWYYLKLAPDSKTVVAHADHAGCSEIQREAVKAGDLTHMWAFLPAGGDYYYVCSRKNGQCITYKEAPVGNLLSLQPPKTKLGDKQKFKVISKGGNKVQLQFKTGDYLHNSRDLTSCSAKHAIKHRSRHENERQTMVLGAAADIKVPNNSSRNTPGKIPGPPPPSSASGEAPPSETEPVVIGHVAIPYFMVKDGMYKTPQDKIRDRIVYYMLERKQNWILKSYETYDPGDHEFKWSSKNGIATKRSQQMEKTVNLKIMADMNMKYKGGTIDLKTEFAKALKVSESSATEEISETTKEHTYKVTAEQPFSIAQWQLQDIYTLYRVSNKKASPVDSWKLGDARYKPHTTYPTTGVTVGAPTAETLTSDNI